jgi:uncharacterized protein YhfF
MNSVKERPILFSGEMVRAILAGRKTQTRRVVKSQPSAEFMPVIGEYHRTMVDGRTGECFPSKQIYFGASDGDEDFPSPYGRLGDRLWVRETFSTSDCHHGQVVYRADGENNLSDMTWKPSIFMPRSASRITLAIMAVRVERLKDISNEDCFAEGLPPETTKGNRTWYGDLWESINGVGSWDKNPWVWVIEFRKINQDEKSK